MMFTLENIKQLQQDIEAALKSVETKHSVKFNLDYTKHFEPYKYGLKADIRKSSPYRDSYLKDAQRLGLELTWLDKQFSGDDGHFYQIIGLDPAKRTVQCSRLKTGTDIPGATYSFQIETIKNMKLF